MRRREFITLLGGAAIAWPLAARAQQPDRMRRIGVLMSLPESDPEGQLRWAVIGNELKQHGWIEDRNIHVDLRWYGGNLAQQQALAKELIALRPDAVFAQSTTAVMAFLKETRIVPIVFVQVVDPVGQGLVSSLARPTGNVTGFSNFEVGIGGKWLELLKEIVPKLSRVIIMYNPATAPYFELYLRSIQDAAASFSIVPLAVPVHNATDVESSLIAINIAPGDGLILPPDVFTSNHRNLINALATRHRLPAVYAFAYIAREGALLSYGPDVVALYRQSISYVDRILRGENPAELPVQQPRKFELVINLKTAKALGVKISDHLLSLADEVIE